MSESLSPSSPIRSCGRSPRSEARPTYTADSALLLSSSEEVDEESIEDVSPSHSPQYEELVEVVTRAVAKLNIDWPAECHVEPQRGKLDECFLWFKTSPPHSAVLHRPILVVSKPFSARLFVPSSENYGNVMGTTECGYRAMPRVKQTLAIYLSPDTALSLKALTLPSKPLRTSLALVGKGYAVAGQAGSCLHTMEACESLHYNNI